MSADCARSNYLPAVSGVWTRPLFACACFVDVECAPGDFFAVERGHGSVSFGFIAHGDEGEAARFAGHSIHHQRHFADFAVLFEKILKIVFGGLKGEISYIQFHCDLIWKNLPASEPFPGVGFQITTEEFSADDLPCNEQNRTNPIGCYCRRVYDKYKRSF